jgi:hypothetical protein
LIQDVDFEETIRGERSQKNVPEANIDPTEIRNIANIENLGNHVVENYGHSKKLVIPQDDLSLPNAYLKWYDVCRLDKTITPELAQESRAFIQQEAETGRLKLENDLGFVILHLAGSVAMLIICTWRNENEIWESHYFKFLNTGGSYEAQEPRGHRPMWCVWELIPIWHERNAWTRYLFSKRDTEAKYAYINDRFAGLM